MDIARPGRRAERCWRIGEGVKAVSWLIDVEGAPTVVAKFFRPEAQDRMARELGFHEVCTVESALLPELLGAREAKDGEQLGVVMTSCLMGQRLADDSGATEADKREVYVDAARFLRAIHDVELGHFGALGSAAQRDDARAMGSAQLEVAIERRRRIGDDPALTDRIAGWARERAAELPIDIAPVLCHGDFSMWNMLVEWREGRHVLSGVFDFESAYAGDPLMELASMWVLTDSWGSPQEAELAAIERGYGDLRRGREGDFELYVVLEKLKLWWYYASRGADVAARDVGGSIARQLAE